MIRNCTGLAIGLAVCLAAVVSIGCGPPAELRIAPPSFEHSARLGDEKQGAPLAATKVEIRSSKAEESLAWNISGAPSWLQVSTTQGGTPADVELKFDLTKMSFGVNAATLGFRQKETETKVQVRYEVLGALKIGPRQSVALRGVVGEERSSIIKLSLDSPLKAGLHWHAKSDDPWLVVEPESGETPAEVSISAVLAKATSNASGRIEFTADSTWQGSPTLIPVVVEILNPEAIRKQIDAKLSLIRSEREDGEKELKRLADTLRTPQAVDAVVQAFRSLADRASTSSKRTATLQQDLLGFLEQNSAYEKVVNFSEVRSAAAALMTAADADSKRLQASVDGIRTGSLTVHSNAEWQRSDMEVRAGDFVAFEATGKWKLGFLISEVGPEGLPTPSIQDPKRKGTDYAEHSVEPKLNHGCLLLRTGSELLAGGASQGLARATAAGKLECRCNDKKYTDNRGDVTVRVAVIPALQ
jgi:hypothetical protein